jgi:ADP-heptose:LPS heptosyltransferase
MILISPYAKALKNGKQNPKNYPYWQELLGLIDEPVIQVGIDDETQLTPDFRKNLSVNDLKVLIKQCRIWVSCDSFFQHLAWSEGKIGIVLWSVSDPLIYGHPENFNLLKSRDCLAPNQFLWWEETEHDVSKFTNAQEVLKFLKP